jgi:sec-independent protein translocase protein TatC
MAWLWRYLPVSRDIPQSIVVHLEDLRRRLLWGLAGFGIMLLIGLWQQDRLLELLMRPAGLTHLVALTVLEPLLVKFKVAFVFGLVMAFPWLLLQALLFVSPALNQREARFVLPLAALSVVLSVVGLAFGYTLVLPTSTRWLLNQAGSVMSVQITALSYVSYAVWFLAAIAATFQTPLVVLSLIGLRVVSYTKLRQQWRTVYLVIVVLSTMVTPDWSPITMGLVAVAMAALYEFSLLLARVVLPGREAPAAPPDERAP